MSQLPLFQNTSSYDAAKSSNRRRTPSLDLRSTDSMLDRDNRDKVTSNSRDLERNFTDVAYMIRLHLSRVVPANFACRSDDPMLDAEVEGFMRWWARPLNCDLAGRASLYDIANVLERRAVVDGDCFLVKGDSGRVQIIESDRVRNPSDINNRDVQNLLSETVRKNLVHGCWTTPEDMGRVRALTICDRKDSIGSYQFNSFLPSQFWYQHAYFDFTGRSQLRGTSPLLSALNDFRDLHENKTYALAKQKLAQLWGIALERDANSTALDEDDDAVATELNIDDNGPIIFDGNVGEKVKFIESDHPGGNFLPFHESVLRACLHALDIPYSIYDSYKGNYSASRLDLQVWEAMVKPKRMRLKRVMDQLTAWRLNMAIEEGVLDIGNRRLSDLRWEWVTDPLPVIDAGKEAKAEKQWLDNGTLSFQKACHLRGEDWRKVIDEKVEAELYENKKREEKGILSQKDEE